MTKSSFHKLLLGSVLMLLPFTVQAQVVLKNWTIEDHSGKVKILVSSDTLEITEHPVEKPTSSGAGFVADHAYRRPSEVVMEVGFAGGGSLLD